MGPYYDMISLMIWRLPEAGQEAEQRESHPPLRCPVRGRARVGRKLLRRLFRMLWSPGRKPLEAGSRH